MLNIDELIKNAMKSKDKTSLETYKLIKAKILEFKTQKNAPEYNDAAEVALLNKMLKERNESLSIYKSNNRPDLAEIEQGQIDVIQALLPKKPTTDELVSYIDAHYPNGIDKKIMGQVIKEIKSAFIGADGSEVANIVKSKLV